MAVIRRRSTRRTTGRRVRRRMNISRPVAGMSQLRRYVPTKLVMKRTVYAGAWTYASTTTNDFWRYQSFTAGSHINNFAELANVFDSYKINAIKQTWRPRYDSVDAASASANNTVYAHIVIDPDTTTLVPTGVQGAGTLNGFLEQGDRVKTFTCNRPFSVYFKPKIQSQGLGGDTQTTVASRFLKTTNTSATHRGYHMYLAPNNFGAAPNLILDSYITVYFTMKDLK